ncbi:hypothetical protein [Nocardia farcinica]|uniref:Uncharacterized protein n=1 Tax=Nocardia farcinica TaxID=37329 RepID=A0A0H5P4C5_NOCFR|nr:hypothetical protein [Nocardia farcinica]SLI13687.1 Uncharacterised protein [Mycobacteroides abscessus subsp. abscessus]PFX01190.1 hypothetical protein CJ469_04003 [Nocardia farcinica]PFX07594.1 hypothetical protein CJ468_03518 [Nocardia farcinica]CRY82517.1 Uncharacterised protein [Nocardia farcinica]SIT25840.1 hypothetical protein SAMN05421776_10622 [Nocardia farcinica]
MLEADVTQIRELAAKLKEAGDRIDGIDVRTAADGVAAALPDGQGGAGSGIPPAIAQAAEFIEGAYLRAAERYRQVATLCTQCADKLETTDEQFANALAALDVHHA